MKLRKTITVIIIAFIIVPLIFGTIYAVASINFATSSRLYTEYLPQTISELPRFIDLTLEMFNENRNRNSIEVNVWLDSIQRANIDFTKVIIESGIADWLEIELKTKLKLISRMVDGSIPFQQVYINLQGLKNIISGKYIENVLIKILSNLPVCNSESHTKWEKYIKSQSDKIPTCRPNDDQIPQILDQIKKRLDFELDDYLEIAKIDIQDSHFLIKGQSFRKIVSFTGFLLFLIPLIMLSLTALLPARSLSDYLRWIGIPIFIGAGFSFITSFFFQKIVALPNAVFLLPKKESTFLAIFFLRSLDQIFLRTVNFFFAEAQKLSLTVLIIGLVLIALAEITKRSNPTN